jgi:diadenosine tetraphosphate (Ap4A) HIT family hydrolase
MISDIEKALDDGTAPWKEIEYRCKDFWIFSDGEDTPEGYLCFVPTYKTAECLYQSYKAAYKWGYDGVERSTWEGFNIVQAVGIVAGQGINYPHIHMIPRRNGDLDV